MRNTILYKLAMKFLELFNTDKYLNALISRNRHAEVTS